MTNAARRHADQARPACENRAVSPSSFTLKDDGDVIERHYWDRFLGRRFPNYERYWAVAVVGVTKRGISRQDIRFRTDDELAAVGKGHEDVTIAQLHYTVMVHLGRAHDLRSTLLDRWTFAEVLVRLVGASDCADELLQRATQPGAYDPWSEDAGREARSHWRKAHGRPLQDIHDYRNRMVHGRVVPEIVATDGETGESFVIYPRLDQVDSYLDWRRALDDHESVLKRGDFASAQVIASAAWNRVVAYCDSAWATYLLGEPSAS